MMLLRSLQDFISPRFCAICGKRLTVSENVICSVCNLELPRTCYSANACDNPLARLLWGRFPLDRAAAWMHFLPHAGNSKLIYDLKYHHADYIGTWLGKTVAVEFLRDDFFENIDALVAVPLTWQRHFRRGYNQSIVIAEGISAVTGIPILKKVVKRTRFNASQTNFSLQQRMENVEGSFRLLKPEAIRGKHILVIDDVITTGSTISSICREMSKAGDVTISVLAIGATRL